MPSTVVNNQKSLQQIIDETSKSTNGRKTGDLDKDAFLNLLVTQLRYQDPLKPVDDKEFIGQMAQFSALEQMQNMNSSMSQNQAYSLIGKHVEANVTNEKTLETKLVEGEVTSVVISKGKSYVVIRGEEIPVERIVSVTDGTGVSSSNLSNYVNLVGLKASGFVYDTANGEIVKVSGTVKALEKGAYEDYAVMDGVNVEISDIVTQFPSTNPTFRKDYLEENKGHEVSVVIVDRATGKKVPVTAVLKEYSIDDGSSKITAVLDQLRAPVESIVRVDPAPV